MSGEHTCGIPGVFLISSVEKSDCTGISCELVGASLSFSESKIRCSKSYSHALAYKSSRLRLTSGSDLYSCGLTVMSAGGWRGVN